MPLKIQVGCVHSALKKHDPGKSPCSQDFSSSKNEQFTYRHGQTEYYNIQKTDGISNQKGPQISFDF